MLTAFKWLQKGSKMKNFRLFQVFTLIAFLLRWIAFKQNYLEQDIILEHQYGHVETLFCLKRAQRVNTLPCIMTSSFHLFLLFVFGCRNVDPY